MLAALFRWLSSIYSAISGFLTDLLDRIFQLSVDLVVKFCTLVGWDSVADYLNRRPWIQVAGYLSYANKFFPLSACFAIALGALGVAASIRLLRWVKSFVPTIGD